MLQYFDRQPYTVAVIGAGSGIGERAAELMGAMGAAIGCLDKDAEAAEDTARAIEAAGGKACSYGMDVTDPAATRAALDHVEDILGPVSGLVNCAGITGKTAVKGADVELADFDLVHDINLRGALIVSQAVLPGMLKRGYGRLLHVASISGKEGNAGMLAYSTSKAGLIGMVKVLGKDYAESGVTINAIAPAVVRTPLVDELPEETVTYMTDKIPMRRCCELDEVAQLIAWIVSPACSFNTGYVFDLTGGRATY
jgi:NAD(P)-dependent dehydrogenase (short-subunit alcohol dehydrogenase family)